MCLQRSTLHHLRQGHRATEAAAFLFLCSWSEGESDRENVLQKANEEKVVVLSAVGS